jgi:polyphosphate kinase
MREYFINCIDEEIQAAKNKQHAEIKIKLNNLVDRQLIEKLYEAARGGVEVYLIIRGISIIDEYLEHARMCIFYNQGSPRVLISSADWMVRNMDYRIEATCPVYDKTLRQELIDIFNIQLSENVKARILDNSYSNRYVKRHGNEAEIRSQVAIRAYLLSKKLTHDLRRHRYRLKCSPHAYCRNK